MTALRFYLDADDPAEVPTIKALAEGSRWNGWRSPVVTASAMAEFVDAWRNIDRNGTWGDVLEVVRDGLPILIVTRNDSDDPFDWDEWAGCFADSGTATYEISGWAWTEVAR